MDEPNAPPTPPAADPSFPSGYEGSYDNTRDTDQKNNKLAATGDATGQTLLFAAGVVLVLGIGALVYSLVAQKRRRGDRHDETDRRG